MLEELLDEEEEEMLREYVSARGKAVLVIDDKSGYQEKLVSLLKQHGYKVETAKSGSECLRKYQGIKPDVVIMNIDQSGNMITARMLRQYYPSSRIILTAPYPISQDRYYWISPYKTLHSSEVEYKLNTTIRGLFEE